MDRFAIPSSSRRASTVLVVVAAICIALLGLPAAADAQQVSIETSKGTIVVELDAASSPQSVENFLRYVRSGFYAGTVFHRVIAGFMIQGGGFDTDLSKKRVEAPVENESKNGLSNTRGTIAMARTMDPHSATAQFYINVVDNPSLDARDGEWGYTVFGRVVQGMDVVDAIAGTATETRRAAGQLMRDVPVENVVIQNVSVR